MNTKLHKYISQSFRIIGLTATNHVDITNSIVSDIYRYGGDVTCELIEMYGDNLWACVLEGVQSLTPPSESQVVSN